jgi:hypothetical protein
MRTKQKGFIGYLFERANRGNPQTDRRDDVNIMNAEKSKVQWTAYKLRKAKNSSYFSGSGPLFALFV